MKPRENFNLKEGNVCKETYDDQYISWQDNPSICLWREFDQF